jgi:hypothetical protein
MRIAIARKPRDGEIVKNGHNPEMIFRFETLLISRLRMNRSAGKKFSKLD